MPDTREDIARRAWLQAMLTHRVLPVQHAMALYKKSAKFCGASFHKDDFVDLLSDSSDRLQALGYDIREVVDQMSGVPVVALVNARQDAASELSTNYSKPELQYIKALVELIFTASNKTYCITSTAALRLGKAVEPPMQSQRGTQDLLNNLVLHGWIRQTPGGKYTLTTRSLLELNQYLTDSFPEHAIRCKTCDELITIGKQCMVTDCDGAWHNHCNKNLDKLRDCPMCKKPAQWYEIGDESRTTDKSLAGFAAKRRARNGSGSEEEEGHTTDEGDTTQRTKGRASGKGKGRGKKTRNTQDDDEEEEEEEQEDEEEEDELATQTQRRTAPERTRAGRGRRAADEEEESDDEVMHEDDE